MFKILVITSCEDDLVSKRFIDTGAKGYVTKGADLKEMVTAIQAVYSGEGYISHNILTKMIFREKSKAKLAFAGLSDREWEIAEMILKGEKAKDIGEKLFLSPKTVNSYRYRIFDKLGIKSDVDLVKKAILHGVLQIDSL
jgi:two-component system, NarL family, invasion response regulator UvrY